ncbi:MAG TPA: DUF1289 domain-containing protein [Steroidobacteraceae bacterium]
MTDSKSDPRFVVAQTLSAQVASPCIKTCTLDERQICVGCGRSLDEIAAWSRMSADERRAVCINALQRMSARR